MASSAFTAILAGWCLAAPLSVGAHGNDPGVSVRADRQEISIPRHATRTIEVKIAPQDEAGGEGRGIGRMLLEKQFHGDLEGTGEGEMLAAQGAVEGSAGYVAMERVRGTLDGRRGSFVLQHSGTMTRGAPELRVRVVPDSGTDDLAGLAGTMTIQIADGEHRYDFTYTLEAAD
jgi:hypothetical protein